MEPAEDKSEYKESRVILPGSTQDGHISLR